MYLVLMTSLKIELFSCLRRLLRKNMDAYGMLGNMYFILLINAEALRENIHLFHFDIFVEDEDMDPRCLQTTLGHCHNLDGSREL